jgi:hypothetical protein
MLLKLPHIEGKIRELAAVIYAPEEFIPTFGFSNQTGLSHIEIHSKHYSLIVCENGVELSRELFDDPDELIVKVFHDISFSMACDLVYEGTDDQNFRERFLSAQKHLMSKIHLNYGGKVKLKQEIVSTEDIIALSESRKNILLKSNMKKTSLRESLMRDAEIFQSGSEKKPLI